MSPAHLVAGAKNVTSTSWQVPVGPLSAGNRYWWWVRAHEVVSIEGVPTDFYSAYSYTTFLPGDFSSRSFITSGLIPNLYSPRKDSVVSTTPIRLEWYPISGEQAGDKYEVWLSTLSDFTIHFTYNLNDISGQIGNPIRYINATDVNPDLFNTKYYWKVRAIVNEGGSLKRVNRITTTEPWSEVWTFTAIPDAPTLVTPINDTLVSIAPQLVWNSSTGAQDYEVMVYASETNAFVVGWTGVTSTNKQVPFGPLTAGSHYWWQVRARVHIAGVIPYDFYSAWSVTHGQDPRFTTTSVIPILVSPSNHSIVGVPPFSVDLIWNSIPGEIVGGPNSTQYNIQLSKHSDFSDGPFFERTQNATSNDPESVFASLTDGIYAQPYYWRVRAIINGSTYGSWSEVWTFTTGLKPPLLVIPNNNDSVSINPILTWQISAGATDYDIQVYVYDSFTWQVGNFIAQTNISTTSWQVPTLLYNTWYEWRVRAHRTDMYGNNVYSVWTNEGIYTCGEVESAKRMLKNSQLKKTQGIKDECWDPPPDPRRFFTSPGVPTPYDPLFDATNVSIQPILSWHKALDAQDYQYQVCLATDMDFKNIVKTYITPDFTIDQETNKLSSIIEFCHNLLLESSSEWKSIRMESMVLYLEFHDRTSVTTTI
jgi:hypothetical protein